MAEFIPSTVPRPRKKKKPSEKYSDILKKRYPHLPKDKLFGGQEVPMDIDKLRASFEQTLKKE
jgi:hypothetical protein